MVDTLSKAMGFSLSTPWRKLPAEARRVILDGSGDQELSFNLSGKKSSYSGRASSRASSPCSTGATRRRTRSRSAPRSRVHVRPRLPHLPRPPAAPEALAVKLKERSIDELSRQSVEDLRVWMSGIELDKRERPLPRRWCRRSRTG